LAVHRGTVSGKVLEFQERLIEARDAGLHLFCEVGVPTLNEKPAEITDEALAECVRAVPRIRSLYLSGSRGTDAGLAVLREAIDLEELNIGGTAVGDDGVAHLEGLQCLRRLVLSNTRITDAALACLRKLPALEILYLTGTAVTDRGLEHLEHLPRLRELWLYKTALGDAAVDRLRRKLPKLVVFR